MARQADSTDQRFWHFCRTGDPAALGEVFDRAAGELLHVAVWLVGDRTDAEDLLQRTFLQAIEARAQFEPGRRVMPWLMGVLANQARLLRRERARRAPVRPPTAADDPGDAAVAAELRAVVRQVQDELGTPYREVLTLHLEEGLNAKEIAARLERPAGTVRTQLVRALERLRRRLPAGFVAGFVPFAVHPAALAAARTAVVEAARVAGPVVTAGAGTTAATVTASAVVTGGVVMSKKALCAGVVLACLVGLLVYQFAWQWPEPATFPGAPDVPRVAVGREPQARAGDPAAEPDEAAKRTALRTPAASVSDLATLQVRLRWADTGEPAARHGVYVRADGPRFRAGTTDDDGVCVLPELAPGKWKVKPALAWEWIEVDLRPGENRTLEADVVRAGRVRGHVFDGEGQPVSGASLWLSEARAPSSQAKTRDYEAGRTDALGRFEVFARGSHRIGARCPGHAPSLQCTVSVGPGEVADVDLRLRGPGGAIRGQVVDQQGQPVAWARVLVGRTEAGVGGATAENWGEPMGPDLPADAEGRFVVEGVAPGGVEVRAWAEGYGPAVEECDVNAGTGADVVVTLPPGAVLTGSVRDDDGEPLAEVWISCGSMHGGLGGGSTHTRADGSFRLENLAGRATYVRAIRWPLQQEERLELNAGEETVWNPVLSDRYVIEGIVLGPDGAPAKMVYVSCGPESGDGFGSATAHPTKAGRFELPNADPGPQRVAVTDRTMQLLVEARNVPAGTRDLVLRISGVENASASVRGRVVDPEGNPVAAAVRVRSLAPRILSPGGVPVQTTEVGSGTWQKALPPGSYQLTVVPKGLGGIHALPTFELRAGEQRDLGDVVVRRPGRATFRVFDPDGTAAAAEADCVVLVKGADGADLGQAEVEAGVATVFPLPPGRWLVRARARTGVAFGAVDVPGDGVAEVELRLQPGTECRIELDCGQLAPPQHARFEVRSPSGAVVARFRGSFRGLMPRMELVGSCSLPPGRYRIECSAEGGLSGVVDVTATVAGGKVELTLPLGR